MEQIDLTQAKPGNTVVIRNGAQLTIDQIIYDPDHEDLEYRIHVKFVETKKPLFYRPNGMYRWGKNVEDPRDIVKIHNTTPQVHILKLEDIGVLATYLNNPPSVKQVLDQINQNVPVKNPLTLETPTGKGDLRTYLISSYEEYNAPTLGELIQMFLSGEYEELNVEDYILTLTTHELETGEHHD